MKILDTRLLPPGIPPHTLRRGRLFEHLNKGLNRTLTLVQAGAGWGKSLLLASFFEHSGIPCAWFNLDPSDRDILSFLLHVIEALKRNVRDLGRETLRDIEGIRGEGADWRMGATGLMNEILDRMPENICMVFDDGHHIKDGPGLKALFNFILRHCPPNFHIYMAAREDPGLETARLQTRHELLELTSRDLGFHDEEIVSLYRDLTGISLAPESIRLLQQYTGGWILPLRMLARSLSRKGPEEIATSIETTGEQNRTVFSYFQEEVFRPLPEVLRSFLIKTSVLNRLHAPLCDATLGGTQSAVLLHDLLDRDLFISGTSGDTEWFRYHPLFREFLKNLLETEVSEEEIRDLHLKAGAWFTEQDEWQEGIYHAISAREFEKAADLLEEKTDDLIRSASADTMLYWIDRLPDAIQEKRAGILFAKGWALVLTGKWNEAYGLLGRAKEMAIREKDQPILGKTLYYLMALLYFQMSYKDIPALAKEAGDHLDPCSPYLPELLRMLATSYMYMNRALKSRSVWEEIRENPVVQNDPVVRLRVMTLRGPHYYLPMGQFDKAVMELEEGIAYYRNHDHMGRYAQYKGYLGYVRHEMGYFKKSQDLFKETATSLRQGGNPLFLTFLYSGLIINAVILGDMKEAEAYFLKSREIQSRFDTSRLQKGHFVLIGSALLAVQKGDREGFFQKADSALKISETIGDYWDYYTVSGHLAPGYAFFGADQKARELLLTALVRAREIGAPYAEARSRLLIASLAHDRGDEGASAAHLESSLSIGEKHGYDFLFLNREYSAFLKLLPLALAGSFSADYLKTLIPRMEPEHAGPVLLGLLKNSDPVVKVQVLNLLSLCGVRDAEGAVRSLQKDPDRAVRESAGRVAKRLEALPPLPLKIRMFGPFRIFQGGREIREESWSRKKALAILKYLIFYQEKKIQTEILIETFYPDLPFDRAYESLRKVMSSLRTGLEPGLPSRKRSAYLNAGKGFYAFILPEKSDVDVFRFDSLLAAAQRSRAEDGPEHSLGGYEEAIKIWQGPFLEEDPYEPWTNLPRERYRSLYIDALREVSRQSFQSFDYGTCIEVLQKILDQDDWDEAAYLLLMKCHLALGDRTRAITTYRVCKQVLSRELQINPSKKLSDLYQSIIRD